MTQLITSAPASGTGSVTIEAPVTASTRTLTLPDETGTLYSSATPVRTQKGIPAFSAYSTGGQSLSATTWTKIAFQNEVFDTTNAFDSATNYRFQPTTAGYYQLNGSLQAAGTANGVCAAVVKNTTIFAAQGAYHNAVTANAISSVSTVIYLNGSTDYVELFGYFSSASTTSTGTAGQTVFSGILIAAA